MDNFFAFTQLYRFHRRGGKSIVVSLRHSMRAFSDFSTRTRL